MFQAHTSPANYAQTNPGGSKTEGNLPAEAFVLNKFFLVDGLLGSFLGGCCISCFPSLPIFLRCCGGSLPCSLFIPSLSLGFFSVRFLCRLSSSWTWPRSLS